MTSKKKKICWAASLGGCSPEMTKEHLISDGLWTGDGVDVLGFDWCDGGTKHVGRSSVASHILCKVHNNALSPLDAAAKLAFASLQSATAIGNQRNSLRPRRWKVTRLEIAAPWLLERWFLKTMLNLLAVKPGGLHWRANSAPADTPPDQLVRIAFGDEPMQRPMGLYAIAGINDPLNLTDIVGFAPLEYGDEGIIAGMFEFRGFRFVLHLEPHALPETLIIPRGGPWSTGQLLYRVERLKFNVGGHLSHYVQLCWHLGAD